MTSILLFKASPELEDYTKQAIEKVKSIFSQELTFENAPNTARVAFAVEQVGRKFHLVFLEDPVLKEDVGQLGIIFGKKVADTVIVTNAAQINELNHHFRSAKIIRSEHGFSADFVFLCIKNHAIKDTQKIDVRIVKQIILSFVDVIASNTSIPLKPYKISQGSTFARSSDICSMVAFMGDGFYGSLTLNADRGLIEALASQMLRCDPSALSQEDMVDVCAELINQFFGLFCQSLAGYGYDLRRSVEVASYGHAHQYRARTKSQYYIIPFSYQDDKLTLVLSYGTYSDLSADNELSSAESQPSILDVRMINATKRAANTAFQQMAADRVGDVGLIGLSVSSSLSLKSELIHILHCKGSCGTVLLALDLPKVAANGLFSNKLASLGESAASASAISDWSYLILRTIYQIFKKEMARLGNSLRDISHCSYVSAGEEVSHRMKNSGFQCVRFKFRIEQAQFDLYLCLEGFKAHRYFDVGPYLLSKELIYEV